MRTIAFFLACALGMASVRGASEPFALGCLDHSLKTGNQQVEPDRVLLRLDSDPQLLNSLEEEKRRYALDPDNPERHITLGFAYLKKADTTNWELLDQAKKHFAKVRKIYPKNSVVLMYLGRVTGAQALNMKPSTFTRLRLAREGFKLMDKAVNIAPDCVWLRLLRGEAQLMAHPILRRKERLKKDANKIMAFMADKQFDSLSPYQQAKLHLFLGCYYEKVKKDRKVILTQWQLAIEKGVGTVVAKEAQARLKGSWQSVGYSGEE